VICLYILYKDDARRLQYVFYLPSRHTYFEASHLFICLASGVGTSACNESSSEEGCENQQILSFHFGSGVRVTNCVFALPLQQFHFTLIILLIGSLSWSAFTSWLPVAGSTDGTTS